MATFPYAPDWSDPPSESIEYPTQVIETFDQHEQRIQLRAIPIHTWEFTPDPTQHRAMVATIRDQQAEATYAPMWHRAGVSTTALTAGSTQILMDSTVGRGFKAGDYFTVWSPGKDVVQGVVHSVTSGWINLVSGLGYSFPVGALVAPTPSALISLECGDFQGIVPGMAPVRLKFRAVSDTRQSISWAVVTNGRPLWYMRPNAVDPPSWTFQRAGYDLGSAPGIITRRTRQTYPQTGRKLTYTASSIAEITDFLKLIETIKGRLVPFYCPTWSEDWETTSAGQGRQQVCAVTYAGVFSSGVYTGWSKVSDALNMWLPAVRMASDVVTITYPSLTTAEMSLDVVDLRYEA